MFLPKVKKLCGNLCNLVVWVKGEEENTITTYSSSATTPTDTFFSNLRSSASAGLPSPSRSYVTSDVPASVASATIAKSPVSADPPFVLKSSFLLSTMSVVFGSSAVTVTGSDQ